MSRIRRASTLALLLVGASCGRPLEIFSDASDDAHRITRLAWFMIVAGAIVFVGVMVTMLLALRRNGERPPEEVRLDDPGSRWIVVGGAIIPAVVLTAVLVVSLTAMGRSTTSRPRLTIDVVGRQWWWEVRYAFAERSENLVTANELHIPVGQPVRVRVTSADVIHSFWVPQLQGKIDVIPGDTNEIVLRARREGTYGGTCAEYCGTQHARMGFVVVVDDSATFAQWAGRQLAEGVVPSDPETIEGRQLFETGPCALCHTVRGTLARGTVAPDLTHFGSRQTIGAGTLGNSLGNLEAWIANAQSIKPGTRMPTLTMSSGRELRALAAYVASLK